MTNAEGNPFAALLGNSNSVNSVKKELVEEIFLFTLSKNKSTDVDGKGKRRALLNLADVIVDDSDAGQDRMNHELLSHAVFERLMLTDTKQYLQQVDNPEEGTERDALEPEAFPYLFRAYATCEVIKTRTSGSLWECEIVRELILQNASTCMRQPELFQGQAFHTQWIKLFENTYGVDVMLMDFLVGIVQKIIKEDSEIEALGSMKAIFYPLFSELQKRIASSSLVSFNNANFRILNYFVTDKRAPQLGEIFIDYTTPNPNAKGGEYMDTLLGQLLCISIMPKNSQSRYEFFNDITMEHQQTDPTLWKCMAMHQENTFHIVRNALVQHGTTKKKMLQWIANCLHANVSRGQIWSNINLSFEQVLNQNASDAFMTSLCAVLMRLCIPLCHPELKVLRVDPTYCAVPEEERTDKDVSMVKACEETCLLPTEENEKRLTAAKYNFITEVFYMAHKAFDLGYRACTERFQRMARELHNLQGAYQDLLNQNPNHEMTGNLMRMLKEQMQQYLCMRNGLMEPENDANILKFFEASAIWLTEIALLPSKDFELALEKKDFAPHTLRNKQIPDAVDFVPSYLKSVPESIIDNIVAYLSISRHFPPGQYIELNTSSHDAFFRMILLMMGNAEFVKNPHLRAKLAEALEFLLPKEIAGSSRQSFMTHVFDQHVDRHKVVRSLLNVFVSIEMTGQSVQFEQKFNYRRPMYAIMEYLWTKSEHVQCFKDLAQEAEQNMEAIEPPLFLRFINLLINDAIFLLDDSLSNLQQIRQLQEAQASGQWESLSHNERQEQVSNLHHLGMMAKFDNILGRDTINVLKLITSEIKSIFCHNSMVDRIAAMLNYFLLNLVGPQKEKFNIRDKKEFQFDPAQTVMEICHIYINLSSSEAFCLAVSQDGRSYSSKLFAYAENILIRIGGGQLIGEMSDFAKKVERMEAEYKAEQEIMTDAPDEFLDPIMSTLMTDPVILPSSKVTVDRSTIARHLLSDQTDPFNRAPLTMDKVVSNVELKTEIEKWLAGKREAAAIAKQS